MNEKLSRIQDKINEIEESLNYLVEITPGSYEEYAQDMKTKAACEHYLEKIVESVIDLAFLVVNHKNIKVPEDEESVFNVLFENEIISSELVERLKDAKGMRNIISHEYGKVDDSKVYFSLTEELERDVSDYLKSIIKYLEIK